VKASGRNNFAEKEEEGECGYSNLCGVRADLAFCLRFRASSVRHGDVFVSFLEYLVGNE
jgi:hypothetical protein